MKEKYVWKKDNLGHVSKVAIDEIKVNDKIVVYVGEKICVDGTIIDGAASIDQSSLTGESIPAFKSVKKKFTQVPLCVLVKSQLKYLK